MKLIVKDTLILFLITFIVAAILGVAYVGTKDQIEVSKQAKMEAAWQEVLPDGKSFEENENMNYDEINNKLGLAGYTNSMITQVLTAKNTEGEEVGYVIGVESSEAYNGSITFYMGLDLSGKLSKISLLQIAETPGLGMQAEEILVPQFSDKKVEQFQYTKTKGTLDEEIDVISGATITTNAIVNGVNVGLYYYQHLIGGTKNENM